MKRVDKNSICRMGVMALLSLLSALGGGAWAQEAASVLDRAAAAYEQSGGLTASFTMQTRSEGQGVSESVEGTLDLRGDKFVLKTPDMVTWFDGTTQWTLVVRNGEVNVSTPSGEELQAINPALLLRSYQKGFTASLKGESTAPSGKPAYDIELLPRKRSDIVRVELQIEKFSALPASIAVFTKNGISSRVRIGKVVTGVNQPDRFFVFNEQEYPDAGIIDLR